MARQPHLLCAILFSVYHSIFLRSVPQFIQYGVFRQCIVAVFGCLFVCFSTLSQPKANDRVAAARFIAHARAFQHPNTEHSFALILFHTVRSFKSLENMAH